MAGPASTKLSNHKDRSAGPVQLSRSPCGRAIRPDAKPGDIQVIIEFEPQARVGHSKLKRDHINRYIPRSAAVHVPIARQDSDAQVTGQKMRAKLRPSIRISDIYRPHHLFNPCD